MKPKTQPNALREAGIIGSDRGIPLRMFLRRPLAYLGIAITQCASGTAVFVNSCIAPKAEAVIVGAWMEELRSGNSAQYPAGEHNRPYDSTVRR
jgi:hypothetical protein